ncbi:pantoate--beta-alanine ligase [Hordeum vulgare]|nr:pantoate--beta-alanine ligase [Hordeum vulgare]
MVYVPTMGFLHEGHLPLVSAAAAVPGPVAIVVFIYVNPSQFAPTEDLATYPSDLAGDLCKLASSGAVHATFSSELRVVSAADASSIREPIDGDSEVVTGIALCLDSRLLFAAGHSKLIRV